jgi:hypothetical protein
MRCLWMMSLALCFSTSAFAGTWAGIPLDSLTALGVAQPALSEVSDVWRAALPAGGFVRVEILGTEGDAREAFAFQSVALTSRPAEAGPPVADEAVGNGKDYLLVRDGNVLISARDPHGAAAVWVERLRAHLTVTAPSTPPREEATASGVRRWDSVGRRID